MSREEFEIDWSDSATCAFDIVASEFVVATADHADLEAHARLKSLLKRVRKAFGVDAAFIAGFADGEHVVHVSPLATGEDAAADPLHAAYGATLLGDDGFHAVPVIGNDGLEYGTLCCRLDDRVDPAALRSVARLIADWFSCADLSLSGLMPLQGQSVMGSLPATFH
jgi:hypothetical protein